MILHRFDTPTAAAGALAVELAALLRNALAARGQSSLLVPGGRTPVALFHALRTAQLDWAHVTVSLTDERWVAEDHPASNAALVRAQLLAGEAAAARFIPLYCPAPGVAQGAAMAWSALAPMPRPFDAVVLGMGEDGHFASLFPDSPGLAAALDVAARPACVAMIAPGAPAARLSLNLAALSQARRLFLLVTGEAKRELIQTAGQSGSGSSLPVASLLALREPEVQVYWAP